QRQLQNAPRPGRLQSPGCCLRALSPGRGRPPGALAYPLLDVSPQAVLEDLRSHKSRFDGPAEPHLTRPVLSLPAGCPVYSCPLTTVQSSNSLRYDPYNWPQSSLVRPTVRPSFWSPPNNNQHWMAAQCGRCVKSFQESATGMFPEIQTREVPIDRTRYVQEVVNDVQKVAKCRMVQEVVTGKVPCGTWT